jgi:predicted amidohydrolase
MKIASLAANESRYYGKTQQEMLEIYKIKLSEISSQKADIVIFPEMLLRMYAKNEPLSREEFYTLALNEMQAQAKRYGCYILFNIYEPCTEYAGKYYNTTLFLARDGAVIGKYRKMHIVDTEYTRSGVLPGSEPCVVETEFGKIGIATCFDVGWRSLWQDLDELGARAVIWTAAYDGGNLLDAYAVTHMYWVMSSVRTYHARVIDPVGRTVKESARWDDWCIADVDMNMEIFHIDNQFGKINSIRKKYGESVEINTLSEENIFTVSSKNVSVDDIKKEFGLISYKEYHSCADALQKKLLNEYK